MSSKSTVSLPGCVGIALFAVAIMMRIKIVITGAKVQKVCELRAVYALKSDEKRAKRRTKQAQNDACISFVVCRFVVQQGHGDRNLTLKIRSYGDSVGSIFYFTMTSRVILRSMLWSPSSVDIVRTTC